MIWSPKFSSSRQQLIVTTGSCEKHKRPCATRQVICLTLAVRGGWLDIEFHQSSRKKTKQKNSTLLKTAVDCKRSFVKIHYLCYIQTGVRGGWKRRESRSSVVFAPCVQREKWNFLRWILD